MIGTTIDDRYAILRMIGKGGMGAVYEARHLGTNRRVAVKVILDAAMDTELVARFQREASIVGSIESQHITLVYDTGRDRGTGSPYIAMELLDGEDAEVLLERLGPLPVDLAVRIAYQACLGLGRAHQAGVVHRDIKTANLFLHRTEGGHRIVKILDFGIAKSTGGEKINPALTRAGAILGSPLYMSPEQAKGAKVDPRSDVWSLGYTLYEMLSGVRPNEEIEQLGELIVTLCTQPMPRIEQHTPRVPAALAALVHRALTIDPRARFSSAVEMGEALRGFLPGGHVIDEGMLRPLDATERGAGSGVAASGRVNEDAAALATSATVHAQSGTVGGLSIGASGGAAPIVVPRATSRAPLLVGAIAITAAGAIAAGLWFSQGASSSTERPAATVEATAASPAASASPSVDAPAIVPSATLAAPRASASATAPTASLGLPPVVAGALPVKLVGGAAPRPSTTAKTPPRKATTDDESSRK